MQSKQNMRYLVIHDVDAIQQYVFTTDRLRDIRGASGLIDKINTLDTKGLARTYKGETIYVGGGGVAADFSCHRDAEDFCQEVGKEYVDQTATASSTGVVVSYDESVADSFRNALQKAHRDLREKKARRRICTQLLTNPYFKRCQACGIYPVGHYDPYFQQKDGRFICQSCRTKRQYGAPQRIGQSLVHRLIRRIFGWQSPHRIDFPDELDQIGNVTRPKGYIGVMYADGNRIGDRLQKIEKKRALGNFSLTIDKATRYAIATALARRPDLLTEDSQGNRILPVLVPLCGGDDLVVIAPAHQIMEIAVEFLQLFSDRIRNKMSNEVATMLSSREVAACAGVAIAKSHTPLNALIDLAHDLCASAKRRSYDLFTQDESEVPCIDFQVLTTPSWEDLKGTRTGQLMPEEGRRLTCRPYTVSEAEELIEAVRTLKRAKFPAGKLNSLYRSLWEGRSQATFHYLTLFARARESQTGLKQKSALRQAERLLHVNHATEPPPWRPWDRYPLGVETPYPDLVEIYPFIEESA